MAAPHNPERYGELWPQAIVDALFHEITTNGIGKFTTLSGGWAWHFLSPAGHPEYKHAHDHRDIDCFIDPKDIPNVFDRLFNLGYRRETSRFDGAARQTGVPFYRFAKEPLSGGRIQIDLFIRQVPFRTLENGIRIIEPATLVTLYGADQDATLVTLYGPDPTTTNVHGSNHCLAVTAARKLLAAGIDPTGRPELVELPKPWGPSKEITQ
jgi:hypothetical protein